MYLEALIARIRRTPRRAEPKADIAEYLAGELPDDLRALLTAQAEHDYGDLYMGDFQMNDDDFAGDVPASGSDGTSWKTRTDRVIIGHTGGGDLWVVDPSIKGATAPVELLIHDEDWLAQPNGDSIEQFLADLYADLDDSDKAEADLKLT